jgi:hypothetical protein
MPGVIEPERINIDIIPGIWTPVQWEMTDEERQIELEQQATASLLWSIDIPEAIVRMLLSETRIERTFEAPDGYNPDVQGAWDSDLVAFKFRIPIRLDDLSREPNKLTAAYDFGELGYWCIEIEPEKVTIERL